MLDTFGAPRRYKAEPWQRFSRTVTKKNVPLVNKKNAPEGGVGGYEKIRELPINVCVSPEHFFWRSGLAVEHHWTSAASDPSERTFPPAVRQTKSTSPLRRRAPSKISTFLNCVTQVRLPHTSALYFVPLKTAKAEEQRRRGHPPSRSPTLRPC